MQNRRLLTRRQMLARAGSGFGLLALADLFARAEEWKGALSWTVLKCFD